VGAPAVDLDGSPGRREGRPGPRGLPAPKRIPA
jgi:hypothetical protein